MIQAFMVKRIFFLSTLIIMTHFCLKGVAYGYNYDLPPKTIIIPSLKIVLPVEKAEINENTWEVSEKGASFGETSALPGKPGKTIIFAHSLPYLFGKLPVGLKKGGLIHIFTETDWFTYRVSAIFTVNPANIEILKQESLLKNKHQLILYTCVGENYSQRFVVVAQPLTIFPASF